jgi:hypothetical protein
MKMWIELSWISLPTSSSFASKAQLSFFISFGFSTKFAEPTAGFTCNSMLFEGLATITEALHKGTSSLHLLLK